MLYGLVDEADKVPSSTGLTWSFQHKKETRRRTSSIPHTINNGKTYTARGLSLAACKRH